MNAQVNKSYAYKQFGNKFVVSTANRSDIVKALAEFCEDLEIQAGSSITGLGALDEVTLRFFDPDTKQYVDKVFKEQLEVTNVTGNIARMNGEVYLHVHIILGRADYSVLSGHLLSGIQRRAG